MNLQLRRRLVLYPLSAISLLFCLSPAVSATDADFNTLLASPLRSDADRKADATRRPLDLLRFTKAEPGMKVLDIAAGGGYTTQVMALAVGAQGKVWAQAEKARPALDQRLADHPQNNIEVLLRSLEDPYPADAPRVDLVTLVLSYHDIVNTSVDRARMNRALFAALKPGGHLVLIDHAAKAGSGLRDTKTLHRIDEQALRAEVEAAGFTLETDAAYWRNPQDPREQAFFDMKIPADHFALRFVRPR